MVVNDLSDFIALAGNQFAVHHIAAYSNAARAESQGGDAFPSRLAAERGNLRGEGLIGLEEFLDLPAEDNLGVVVVGVSGNVLRRFAGGFFGLNLGTKHLPEPSAPGEGSVESLLAGLTSCPDDGLVKELGQERREKEGELLRKFSSGLREIRVHDSASVCVSADDAPGWWPRKGNTPHLRRRERGRHYRQPGRLAQPLGWKGVSRQCRGPRRHLGPGCNRFQGHSPVFSRRRTAAPFPHRGPTLV